MNNELQKKIGQVVAKSWADHDFRQRLIQNPTEVLSEHGIKLPEGTEVRVLEDTDTLKHIVLPTKPETEDTVQQLAPPPCMCG